MPIEIKRTEPGDAAVLGALYDELIDYLTSHINYPGWVKGVYPTLDDAHADVAAGTAYIAWSGGRIAGSIVLNDLPEEAPPRGNWLVDSDRNEVLAVHRLVVHPDFLRHGMGESMLHFADSFARENGILALRLDVYEGNLPAIRLYEKHGYRYIDWVDLGLGRWGLDRFLLYEKPISG